jgi:hypothetical protein
MTPAQNRRYWKKWGEVKKLLTTLAEFSAKDAEEQRKLIQASALDGVEKSSKDLTNKELDKVYDALDAYLVLVNGPSAASTISQPCKRLIWAIEQLRLDEPYIESIAFDQFKTRAWRSLTEAQLTRFRYTCNARASALKRAASLPRP